jgi:site-specific DNA recombinase
LTTTPRKRAVIYCRVSTDKQEQDGESLDYQEDKCRRYAELHDMDVVIVLLEAKSGFIHYSLREKLTLARQFIRDHLADVIIVFDLRRFSRNFVHSAMIFEEIESNGGEIVSVSENIDNSLTGKLIRSILAWSAESEREKIVEYANRHWQTRLEHNLPMGTGRAPYGWEWGDTDKTFYMVNQEEAAVRFSLFHMFVELDMSLRSIAHKLTEDGILPPAKSRGAKVKSTAWQPSTVHLLLTDTANIGVLTICKTTKITAANGTFRQPNQHKKTIPNGLPAIIPIELYERAQAKLKTNQVEKSHPHRRPEDFLLKGHIFCKTCDYRMVGRYQTSKGTHTYPYYRCTKLRNKYDACPDLTVIRTGTVNELVWADCCRVFERLDVIRDTIERNIEQSLQNMLEDTKGRQLIIQAEADIAHAKQEQDMHPEGSYLYNLIAQDISDKQERLRRYQAEYAGAGDTRTLADAYRRSILGFLNFLDVMRGKYHQATFQDKRNSLDVLGVKVYVYPDNEQSYTMAPVEIDKEWLSVTEAAILTGIGRRTLQNRIDAGTLTAGRDIRPMVIHRHELNRLLRDAPVRLKSIRAQIAPRIEITYSPKFTGVQSSLG